MVVHVCFRVCLNANSKLGAKLIDMLKNYFWIEQVSHTIFKVSLGVVLYYSHLLHTTFKNPFCYICKVDVMIQLGGGQLPAGNQSGE